MNGPPDLARLGLAVRSVQPVGGGDTCQAWRAELATGVTAFVKSAPPGATGMLELEAAGLNWLARCGADVPEVLAVGADELVLAWVTATAPSPGTAAGFGRMLARLHQTPAEGFGVAPPNAGGAVSGWVGAVEVPFGSHGVWADHYVTDRLVPAATAARRCGGLDQAMAAAIDDLCDALVGDPLLAGPPTDPAPIHGDLWSGNVLWSGSGAFMVDPAACGGHPETDLAMLHLFGAPFLDHVVAGYEAEHPLPAGWRGRLPLHQVFPLLVHTAMFGRGYGRRASDCARTALSIGS